MTLKNLLCAFASLRASANRIHNPRKDPNPATSLNLPVSKWTARLTVPAYSTQQSIAAQEANYVIISTPGKRRPRQYRAAKMLNCQPNPTPAGVKLQPAIFRLIAELAAQASSIIETMHANRLAPNIASAFLLVSAAAQSLPPLPAPLSVPKPGPQTEAPYAPGPILPGGVVVPLYPPGSPLLNTARVREPEQYNMSQTVAGRINSIVNIHNPSIEVHLVDRSLNTGAAVILVAGGGHNTLNVGSESADFVPFFYNYGVNTIILRNRLRRDGYNPQVDAVNDALQSIRLVRAYAKEWNIDPNKIGMMGFSAGAELAAAAAVLFDDFDKKNGASGDPLTGISSRLDFVGIIYPGPSPFARNRTAPPIPRNVPPAFLICGGSGDRIHAIWAMDYYSAMLTLGVPNIEMHLYGNGRHPGDPLPDGTRMTGGLTDRGNIPFGTWQYRFTDWFRDLGFLQKPGVVTKAAKDVAEFVSQPPIKPPGPQK